LSDKTNRLTDLLAKVPAPSGSMPSAEGRTLLEVGFLCVLGRRLSESQADRTLAALKAAFPDWNELRVSQSQEFQHLVQSKSTELSMQVARDVREYLQEIYQKIHGFDLDIIRGDINEAARFASNLPFLGASAGHYILWLACPGEVPISPAIVRTLDRLGLSKRTSSIKKAQAALESLVPESVRADFAMRVGYVVERWCDARKPVCWECPLVLSCPLGKRVEREWKQTQKRLGLQRVREEERLRKEQEKERRRAAAEEKRRMVAKAKESARKLREVQRARAKAAAAKAAEKKTAKAKAVREKTRKKAVPKKSLHKKAARKPTTSRSAPGRASAPRNAQKKKRR